jgi:hypothetical protein
MSVNNNTRLHGGFRYAGGSADRGDTRKLLCDKICRLANESKSLCPYMSTVTAFYSWLTNTANVSSPCDAGTGLKNCLDVNPMVSFHMIVEAHYTPSESYNILTSVFNKFYGEYKNNIDEVNKRCTLANYLDLRDAIISKCNFDDSKKALSHRQMQQEFIAELQNGKPSPSDLSELISKFQYADSSPDQFARDLIKCVIHTADFDFDTYVCVNYVIKNVFNKASDVSPGSDGASQISVCSGLWLSDSVLVLPTGTISGAEHLKVYPSKLGVPSKATPFSQHSQSLNMLRRLFPTSGGSVTSFLSIH